MKKSIIVAFAVVLAVANVVFAGQFKDDDKGLYYVKDDGSYAVNEWIEGDFNQDGIIDSYYFNGEGYYDKNAVKQEVEDTTTLETKIDDEGNGVNPDNIPPKVQSAINYIRSICNEDGLIIIPYSKRLVRIKLEIKGYKKDTRNLAIDKCGVNWLNHAVVFAKGYSELGYRENRIKDLMKFEGFNESDIQYALKHLNGVGDNKIYVNPFEYIGLNDEQKMQKLLSLGLDEKSAKEAMAFLTEVQR